MWRDKDNNISWFIVYSIFFYSFFIKILFSWLIYIMDGYYSINSINPKDALDPWTYKRGGFVSFRKVSWLVKVSKLNFPYKTILNKDTTYHTIPWAPIPLATSLVYLLGTSNSVSPNWTFVNSVSWFIFSYWFNLIFFFY